MSAKGQVIVVVAILILVGVTLLALLVDGGRLYWQHSQAQRGAQSAADAGMGLVAEHMVTLAVPRQTEAASLPPCLADGKFGDEMSTCTATPEPEQISRWLQDEDRQKLVEPELQESVRALAIEYADRNGFRISDPNILDLTVEYPYRFEVEAETIRLRVFIKQRVVVLMAALLNPDLVDLPAEAISELLLR